MHGMQCTKHTLVWEAVEVGGVWDVEADGEQGSLVGKDQVLVGPGMGGHLPKHQLPLRHLQARLHSKTLQGALELLGAPALIMHLCVCLHKEDTTNKRLCWPAQSCYAGKAAHCVYTRKTQQTRHHDGLRKAVMLAKPRQTHVSP